MDGGREKTQDRLAVDAGARELLLRAQNSLLTGKNTGNSLSWLCQLGDNSTRQSNLEWKSGSSDPIGTGNYQGMNRESKFPVSKKKAVMAADSKPRRHLQGATPSTPLLIERET
jgi:hypothetical protein